MERNYNEPGLIESISLRMDVCKEEYCSLLEKIGELKKLPETAWATTEQVAEFYEVMVDTIKKLVIRHKDEFVKCGYKLLYKNGLAQGQDVPELNHFKSDNYRIAIFPRPAILLCGCLLQNSPVAKMVRRYLIQTEQNLSPLIQEMASNLQRLNLQMPVVLQRLGDMEKQTVVQSIRLDEHESWLLSLENHFKQLEDFLNLVEVKQSLANLRNSGEKITQDQIQRLKAKAKMKRNSRGLWLKFNHHFGLSHYWDLPETKFMQALEWFELQP